jgi:hypothetical protein
MNSEELFFKELKEVSASMEMNQQVSIHKENINQARRILIPMCLGMAASISDVVSVIKDCANMYVLPKEKTVLFIDQMREAMKKVSLISTGDLEKEELDFSIAFVTRNIENVLDEIKKLIHC